jgi:DNA-binding SARP family transcriptional activator
MGGGRDRSGGARRPAATVLCVRTLGKLTLRVGERTVGAIGRKSAALLAYLALSDSGQETRERLVGLLWSETEEEKARASLRQSLHEIREAFNAEGFEGFRTDKVAIGLDLSRTDVDLRDIFDEAKAGRPHPLLLETERPIDRVLEELDGLDPAFRIWLVAKRQSLGDRLIRLIEAAVSDAEKRSLDRETLARALMRLDPTHEEAARVLIRSRAAAGDIGGALRVYKALWDLLDDEYDVEPSKETQELIAAIKLGQLEAEPLARPDVAAHSPAHSLTTRAITPSEARPSRISDRAAWPKLLVSIAGFEGSAVKEDSRYLLQGFRRELIACLVRFREWVVRDGFVAPAGATFSGTDGAEYLIEASAIATGDTTLRLIITLREVATSAYLWSERLNISAANWFEAQLHVVRRITTALNVHLSAERLVSIAHRPPGDLKAYDLWLLGQATFLSFDPNNWEKARSVFREVIAQMPTFAPAYSSLAQLNNSDHIVRPGVFRDLGRSEQSLMYARDAARLDPIDSRSQLCLGWSHAMVKQYEQALIFISLAYELNENDPWTMVSAAGCLAVCGEYARAREIAEHALELPLAPSALQWAYHVSIRFMGGDYAGAVRAANAAGDLSYVPGYKASALYHLGDRAGAASELNRFFDITRKKWVGSEPPTDANITRWLLTMVPIRQAEDWQRVRDGLAGAGAPVEGLAHHQW